VPLWVYCSERRYINAQTQYNTIFLLHSPSFLEEIVTLFHSGNYQSGVRRKCRLQRGMKYPEGNVPDPSWADEQAKMLIMPPNLLNAKKLSRRFMC